MADIGPFVVHIIAAVFVGVPTDRPHVPFIFKRGVLNQIRIFDLGFRLNFTRAGRDRVGGEDGFQETRIMLRGGDDGGINQPRIVGRGSQLRRTCNQHGVPRTHGGFGPPARRVHQLRISTGGQRLVDGLPGGIGSRHL